MRIRAMSGQRYGNGGDGEDAPKRAYTSPRDVAHGGCCPECKTFNRVDHTSTVLGRKVQYRYCDCGRSYTTTVQPNPSKPLEN